MAMPNPDCHVSKTRGLISPGDSAKMRPLMDKPKVLVADAISDRGVEDLKVGGELDVVVKTGLKEPELLEIANEFSGIVVRSQTKITAKVI